MDKIPEFEITDLVGSTDTYTGTVDSSGIYIPSSPGNIIEEISIRNAVDQPIASRLEFSYDGINWFRLLVGESREDEFRGAIRQIQIRSAGSLSTCKYEIIMNRGQE